jgi:predicted dehydrogenase
MLTRRRVVQGALAALPLARLRRSLEAADDLRIAVIGLEGRGAVHAAALAALPGVRVTALCDVDELVLLREARRMRERGRRPGLHAEYRRVLDRSDVDAVGLATPNHWHALQTIWACQAGKDVYVESPATHFLSEGAPMVAAAARHARMVQCGLQWRASTAIAAALAWLRAGDLGTPELVHAMCFEPRASLGKTRGNQRVADTVDYDRWCGPSPLLPLRRARLHHDWRWVHATGDGELGAVGAHVLDLARWAAGAEDLPRTVRSVGMRAVHDDDGETPNAQVVFYGTDPVPILLELRGLPRDAAARAAANSSAVMDTELSVRTGVVVRCTGGTLAIPDPAHAIARDPSGAEIRRFEGAGDPFASWLEACRTRRIETLVAPLDAAVRSAALTHVGNASHRTGRRTERNALLAAVAGVPCLATGCERLSAHLAAHGVDVAKPELVLGAELTLDPGRGAYDGSERAEALLAGAYRAPYELPAL